MILALCAVQMRGAVAEDVEDLLDVVDIVRPSLSDAATAVGEWGGILLGSTTGQVANLVGGFQQSP